MMDDEYFGTKTPDRLEEMLKLQDELQRRYHEGLSPCDFPQEFVVEYINLMILATTDELHEALREMPWKPWSKSQEITPEAMERFKDELVDAWHFFMNLVLVSGMTADEFFTRYLRKNGVNHGRIDDGYASTTG
jgi:hypothetical protein